ncbi:MAG: hypothetical protein P4L84_30895 [Isosphaeraceae bacterium]|nr:hypothetical protein [Isosphaeraceae bacterium]
MIRLSSLRVAILALTLSGAESGVTTIEPSDLTKRPELVGREIATDDRLRLFQYHKGEGYDELYLKRTSVIFRLPKRLRPEHPPGNRVFGVRGVLGRDGDRWFCDVTALEPLPDDIDRLNQGVAGLTPRDDGTRLKWALWAEKRAKDFDDKPLKERARELEGDAIRIEAQRTSADNGEAMLALAERARSRGIPEPEPSALAHRAFRKLVSTAKTPQALAAFRTRIEAFFPTASRPPGEPADLARWLTPYAHEPAEAYRMAPPEARKTLDRRLWADTAERVLTLEAEADPAQAVALSETAASQLPDRPLVASRLLESGLKANTANLLKLRQAEVESIATLYREKLHSPERAEGILRDWLNAKRQKSLRPSDAEGRLNLANQYEALLNDRETAIALLYEAYKIDPASKEITEAFLLRGCKKGPNGEWVDPRARQAAAGSPTAEAEAPASLPAGQKLRGATEDDVRSRLGGKPNRVARTASQGQAVEQWIYYNANQVLYVNFARSAGDSRPRVIAFYSRRRTPGDPPGAP